MATVLVMLAFLVGMTTTTGQLEINLGSEVATIKRMFEPFLQKQTFHGTAIALNAQGYRTREGDVW